MAKESKAPTEDAVEDLARERVAQSLGALTLADAREVARQQLQLDADNAVAAKKTKPQPAGA